MLENLSVLGAMKRVTLATLLVVVTLGATARAQDIIPIAAIHANIGTYTGQIVTVEGVVTIPANYRGPSFYSGYIQDGSGRGLNLFGGSTATPPFALNTVGNRVQVTGEVAVFSTTTIELTNITNVQLVSSGSPLAPIQLSTLAANDARWEGTLIEVSGNVDSVSATTGGARNYYLNDGTGRIVARVYTSLGLSFTVGQHVTARGAGTNFNGLYEFYVGQASDMFVSVPSADTVAPVLAGAWAPAASQVIVTFGEALDAASGSAAASYAVFETANPSATVGVGTVTLLGPVATLALSGSLAAGTDYTVRASNVDDLSGNTAGTLETAILRVAGPVDETPPALTSAAAPSLSSVTATFSEAIDPTTGGTSTNYSVFPAGSPGSPVGISSVSVAGGVATLTLGTSLTAGGSYTLTAQGIQDLAGNVMSAAESRNFTAPGGGTTTPIATIQNNLRQYKGQTVTVQGQVYIRSNYRGTVTSGYIQDDSGRGINVFGSTMNVAALQTLGNNVQMTAVVDTYFTTIELVNATNITLLGNSARRQPQRLSTGAAASSAWEGTFIEIAGPISAKVVQSTAINYTVNDGSGNIVVRVVSTVGATEFNTGQTITARGAGGQFQQDFQVLVGEASDIVLGSGEDTTPPTLTGATAPSLTSVRASFSESIDPASGGTTGNYSIYPTSNPSSLVPIASVSVSGAAATLALGSALTAGTSYTLTAQNIADLFDNVMTSQGTATFTPSAGPATTPIADIQNDLRQYKGQTVTVEGQIYIPTNYRGTTTSGYIQDGSGRGINLFGSTMNNPLLQDVGNIVRVTAVVDTYFTTIELVNATNITLVSGGNPPLQPQVLSTGAAANSQWEGTYIQITAPITAKVVQSNAINYTVNDGSGNLVVRVVSTVGAPEFNSGQTITARGAGGQFQQDFQLLVGLAANIFTGGGGDTTPPSVTGVTTPSLTQAVAAFSEAVTTATGNQAANYTLFETATPGNTVPVTAAALAANRRSATLSLGSTLVAGRGYSLRVTGLTDDANNTITAPQTVNFTATVGPVTTPIADIQNNLRQYKGTSVTVQGQVYIPTNYRGTTTSGYIQDGSGRGINLFGSSMNSPLLQNTGNIVRLTATVDTFFTTVELVNGSNITLVSSSNPPLVPTVLSTGAAASPSWEGTYILVTGTITAKVVQSTAINYTMDDGSGPIVARVVSTIGATEFNVGQLITARGAGGQFQSDFQVLVGEAAGIFEGEPTDTFPPALIAALATGAQTVRADFNEAVTATTAEVVDNYEVFRTSNPSETVPVTSARVVREDRVELGLESPIVVAQGWTLRVRNVTDLLGNPIPAAGVTRVIELAAAETATLDGPPHTFLPLLGEAYPITFTVPPEAASGRGHVLLRIFDMRGRLQRTLFDSRFEPAAFTNNRAVRNWDGRDDRLNYVAAGAYVVHLLISFERADEDTQQLQMPVVVATRLDR